MKKLKEILLIDDDQVSNFLSEKLLMKLEITEKVVIKKNGKEGLDYIIGNCNPNSPSYPQYIILDYDMPIMDGLEFLTKLNYIKLKKTFHIVILLLAVQIHSETLQKFKDLGIQNYTLKPLDEKTALDTYYKYWNKDGVWIG